MNHYESLHELFHRLEAYEEELRESYGLYRVVRSRGVFRVYRPRYKLRKHIRNLEEKIMRRKGYDDATVEHYLRHNSILNKYQCLERERTTMAQERKTLHTA